MIVQILILQPLPWINLPIFLSTLCKITVIFCTDLFLASSIERLVQIFFARSDVAESLELQLSRDENYSGLKISRSIYLWLI